jgi:hypothetical protein
MVRLMGTNEYLVAEIEDRLSSMHEVGCSGSCWQMPPVCWLYLCRTCGSIMYVSFRSHDDGPFPYLCKM